MIRKYLISFLPVFYLASLTLASLADTQVGDLKTNQTSSAVNHLSNDSRLSLDYETHVDDEGDYIHVTSDDSSTTRPEGENESYSTTTAMVTSTSTPNTVTDDEESTSSQANPVSSEETSPPAVTDSVTPSPSQPEVTDPEASTSPPDVTDAEPSSSSPVVTEAEPSTANVNSTTVKVSSSTLKTVSVTYQEGEGEGGEVTSATVEPIKRGGLRTWAVVLVSVLFSFAAIFTILYFIRAGLIRKRKADQRRLLRGSVSSEGFFYGDDDGNSGKFEL